MTSLIWRYGTVPPWHCTGIVDTATHSDTGTLEGAQINKSNQDNVKTAPCFFVSVDNTRD